MSIQRKGLIPRALSITMVILLIPGALLFEYVCVRWIHIFIFGAIFFPGCAVAGHFRKKKGRLHEPLFYEVKLYNFLDKHLKYRPFDIQTRRIENFWRNQVEDGVACEFKIPQNLKLFPDRCYLKGVSFILKASRLNVNPFSMKELFWLFFGIWMTFPLFFIWEFPEEIQGVDRERK
jgi:hypothetical protein